MLCAVLSSFTLTLRIEFNKTAQATYCHLSHNLIFVGSHAAGCKPKYRLSFCGTSYYINLLKSDQSVSLD